MKRELSPDQISKLVALVEQGLNSHGSPKVEVAIKNGEVAVYQVMSKRIV